MTRRRTATTTGTTMATIGIDFLFEPDGADVVEELEEEPDSCVEPLPPAVVGLAPDPGRADVDVRGGMLTVMPCNIIRGEIRKPRGNNKKLTIARQFC
jgi:hypothetical protein